MLFHTTSLVDAFLIEPERRADERGFFARYFCKEEFSQMKLETDFVQGSYSFNRLKGTLRGLHYQTAPYEETKLITCISGAVFDVILDLRPESTTFGNWQSFELSEENRLSLYVPKGFAHGIQTLTDNTTVLYQISEYYNADSAVGIRWDDQELAIKWPLPPTNINERDLQWPSVKTLPVWRQPFLPVATV